MSFQERVYSVLVVSAAGRFNDALQRLLPESTFQPIVVAGSVAAAQRQLLDRNFDIVLINAPLPDDPGIKLACDLCHGTNTVALLLIKAETADEINAKVVPQGVFTLSKPTSPPALLQGMQWMISARERLRGWEKQAASIDEKMEEIRQVNRAKWLLIEFLSMTEADAHRYIEKQAMDRCVSRREIAQNIIRTYG